MLYEGTLTKADGTAYADADAVTLINNGLMYLFSQISYYLSDKEIETVQYPVRTTTMFGLLTYPVEYQNGVDLNRLWYRDTTATAVIADNAGFAARQSYLIQQPTTKGTFSFMIPLRHIFVFVMIMISVFMDLNTHLLLLEVLMMMQFIEQPLLMLEKVL